MDRLGFLLQFSGMDATTKWVAIALGVLTLLYIVLIRPLKKERKKDPLQRGEPGAALAQRRIVEHDMSNLLVQYEQMIREMTAGVDTRAAKLELLIKKADEKIAALRRAGGCRIGARVGGIDEGRPGRYPRSGSLKGLTPGTVRYTIWPTGAFPRGTSPGDFGRPHGEIELILALRSRTDSVGVTS